MSPDSDWYADPGDPNGLRWWTGAEWTEHTVPADTFAAPDVSTDPTEPPLVPADGVVRVAPPIQLAPTRRLQLPRQPRPPSIESIKPAIPLAPAASSSITLLPESEDVPAHRRGRRRSKHG